MATSPNSPKPSLSSLRISDTKRNASKSSRAWLWVAVGLAVLVILGISATILRGGKPEVEVATARKPVTGPAGVLNASGYVTPRRRATIAAKITGRVTKVFVDEGTRVSEGQLLATLDDADARRALDSSKADRDSAAAAMADYQVQLRNAEIQLKRTQQLVTGGVQAQQSLDDSTTNADSLRAKIALVKQQVLAAEAKIREQQQAVDNCTIRAPFAGIAVSKDAQVGEMVSPVSAGGGFTRTGIATIVDLHSNEIEVDVSEAYISRVQPNQPVTAVLDAYPDWQIPAKVRTVIPTADRQKATVKVRISFTDDSHVKLIDPATEARILPDMGVKVTFLEEQKPKAKEEKSDAVALIPQVAVHTEGGTNFVFAVKGDIIERRAVTVGTTHGGDIEIKSGIQPETVVVVKSTVSLSDGQAVQIKQ